MAFLRYNIERKIYYNYNQNSVAANIQLNHNNQAPVLVLYTNTGA